MVDRRPTAYVEKCDYIMGMRLVDIAASLVALFGLCVFFGVMVIMAVADFARLISSTWANQGFRWVLVIFWVAVLWVIVRWKKMNG